MINLLRAEWHPPQECELLDAGGGWVARLEMLPNGTVKARPDPFGLHVFWKRQNETLSIVDVMGEPVAHFGSEGLDSRGRKLFWGSVKVGPHWLDHCLRNELVPRPSISFCISCRGRLHHLRRTLLQNIADNKDYPNLEFVLLDYNSVDGLGEWVRRELHEEIESGRLNYYFTAQPNHFHAAHARNMSIRLATGEIVCIVDADNYTGRSFAFYVADHVTPDNVLIGCRIDGNRLDPDNDEGCVGRCALYKTTFLDVGGMDEAHVGWGYDDLDLYARLNAKGYRLQAIESRYTRCIAHDDLERRKELLHQDIGRDSTAAHGSFWQNAQRSRENLEAGRVVLNNGQIGCGGVIKNLGQAGVVVRQRRNPGISICIACGARAEEVRRSLPENLVATHFYPNLEFIVLDNPDGALGPWLTENLARELESGRVVHCRTAEPFHDHGAGHHVHQLNMAARLATGEILCIASPSDRFSPSFTRRLVEKFHAGWIHEPLDRGGLILSRHLFYLAEGIDQSLPAGDAEKDLLIRIEQRLDGRDQPVWSRSGLECRDFGGGVARRNGDVVVISPHRFPRITFTTTCMGRLHHLRETLPQNLADNREYPNLEFLLLNYGDLDGLDEWVQTEMREQIETGRLVYYRSPKEGRFRCAHAKNMAMRLATGELLCNVDADNMTGHHFAFHVAQRLQEYDFLVGCLYPNDQPDSYCDQGMAGRTAVRRPAFYDAGGFDEAMLGWGYDDLDFYERLKALGYRGASIDGRFLNCIAHSDAERAAYTGVEDIGGIMRANEGTARDNRERSRRNIDNRNLVLNAGQIGCGSVLQNFEISTIELKPVRFRKISLCVSCMNRLHHLSETLPRNLADNVNYPSLEIVLLDYNSSDGLENWAQDHLQEWIKAGRLVYFRTTDRPHFCHSHARNLAFRLASGDIVCTIDADNFTGRSFVHYVNERFDRHEHVYLRPDFDGAHIRLRDVFGRICVRKQDFLRIEGYDEQLVDYGYEDIDLCARLEKVGLAPCFIEDDRFLRYIGHGNRERLVNGPILSQVSVVLRGRETGKEWDSLMYLLDNGDFIWLGPRFHGLSTQGRWTQTDGRLLLTGRQGSTVSLRVGENDEFYVSEQSISDLHLRRSHDVEYFSGAVLDYVIARNEGKYRSNMKLADCRVNAGRFGQANVSKNFSPHTFSVETIERRLGEDG
jgi:glycosyltransferase involved in cell wall biosynthesis